MRRILQLFFGFRPDLPLSEGWWHRLATVAFVLTLLAIGAVTAAIAYSGFEPETVLANVEILTTQQDFMKAADKRAFNVTPEFLASPGILGATAGDRINWIYSGDVAKRTCTPDVYAHMAELVNLLNNTPSGLPYQTVESATKLLEEADVHLGEGACMTPDDSTLPNPENIVKYRFTTVATSKRFAMATATTVGIMLAVWVALANLYYRGLVYVVCGPRKKPDFAQT